MEIKPMSKITSVSLTIVLLLGGSFVRETSNIAGAQPNASPSASISPFPSSVTTDTATPFTSTLPDQKTAFNEPNQGALPIWGWLILGSLGLWNAALSFLFWQSIKKSNRTNYETKQNLKRLEKVDVEVNQRVSRKFDELKGQLSFYKKTLEVVQLQAQSKSSKSDDYNFESRNKPVIYGSNEPSVSQNHDYKTRSSNYDQSAPAVVQPWDSIVQNYNLSPQALESHIIERVSESEESVVTRRGNSSAAIILKSANNCSYWIFEGEDRNYWLTPKSDLKITSMGFDAFQALFEFPEYQQGSKIQLVKPAKVAQNSSSGGWDLVEKGQVQFVR
jgi:hypothetical protein